MELCIEEVKHLNTECGTANRRKKMLAVANHRINWQHAADYDQR